MRIPKPITIDFETEGIDNRPEYPPRPTAVSILRPGRKRADRYIFGHPEGNNCTKARAKEAVRDAYREGTRDAADGLLFQNGKFDTDVAEEHLGLAVPRWDKIHDTLFLLFLHDPYARSLSLKPAAERLLGWKPEEQDAVKDWIFAHVPEARGKTKQWRDWGRYICRVPGEVVGPYMDGDCLRTSALFSHLYPYVQRRNMVEAYDRERHLMPILLRNEREGMRVDLPRMKRDHPVYTAALRKSDDWIRRRLKAPSLNVDSDDELAKLLESRGIIRDEDWVLTKTGKRSIAKKNLTLDKYQDRQLAQVLGYRNRLATCLRTFMEPWIEMAEKTGGRIHTSWNQVRQADERNNGGVAGARTGRPSSTPNFFNIPKEFAEEGGWTFPKWFRVPPLPLMRVYILPDEGCVFLHRDYSQQELRWLAHFEDGDLMHAYQNDPKLDVHGIVMKGIKDILHREWLRRRVKNFVFQQIYGGGIPATCGALECDTATARQVINVLMTVLPGYKELNDAVKATGKRGEAIRTWGGREYFCEPPGFSKKHGREMTYEYKLLNYLIQGSSADNTKEATIRYDEHPQRKSRFLVSVYDEFNVSTPCLLRNGRVDATKLKKENLLLRDVMQSIACDVPLLSEGSYGPNWAEQTKLAE